MSQSIVDTDTYTELCEGMGTDFVAELVTTFLSEAPKLLATLKTAAADQDADSYRRAAHSIKSNAEIFGATMLADISRDMELSDLTASAPRIPDLEEILAQTETTLRALVDA